MQVRLLIANTGPFSHPSFLFFSAYPVTERISNRIPAIETSPALSMVNAIALPTIPGVGTVVVVTTVVVAMLVVTEVVTEVVGTVVCIDVVTVVVSGHGPQGPPQSTPVSL